MKPKNMKRMVVLAGLVCMGGVSRAFAAKVNVTIMNLSRTPVSGVFLIGPASTTYSFTMLYESTYFAPELAGGVYQASVMAGGRRLICSAPVSVREAPFVNRVGVNITSDVACSITSKTWLP